MKKIKFGALSVAVSLAAPWVHRPLRGRRLRRRAAQRCAYRRLQCVLSHERGRRLRAVCAAGRELKAENLETLYAGLRPPPACQLRRRARAGLSAALQDQRRGSGDGRLGAVQRTGHLERPLDLADAAPRVQLPERQAQLRPYLGVGVNYTTFYDRDSTAAGNAASGGPTKLSLTASVGPAVTGGVTYRITDRWHLHASYSWSQVKTNLTADTDGFMRTSRISFGPQALIVFAGGYLLLAREHP